MTANRPQPRPGVLDIAPYVPGKSSAPGVAKVFKLSSNETPLGPSAKRHRRLSRGRRAPGGLSGRLGLRVARGDRRGLRARSRRASSAAPAPTICSICSRAPISPTATRRSTPRTASWSIRSPRSAPAPTPVVAPETNYTADVDAILKRVTPKTKIVFLANPNNPTGTYIPFDEVKRLHSALAGERAAGAGRGLCRICPAQRLRVRHRTGRHHRQRRDDPHLLEDLRAGRAAARLDVRAGALSSTRSTASAGRSTSTRRRSRPASPPFATPRMSSARARTIRAGSPG